MPSETELIEIAEAAASEFRNSATDKEFIRKAFIFIERRLEELGYGHNNGYRLSVGLQSYRLGASVWHAENPACVLSVVV